MATSIDRLTHLRDDLLSLQGHDNALIRTAVREAIHELDLADLADDPEPHLRQITRLLDAVIHPDNAPEPGTTTEAHR